MDFGPNYILAITPLLYSISRDKKITTFNQSVYMPNEISISVVRYLFAHTDKNFIREPLSYNHCLQLNLNVKFLPDMAFLIKEKKVSLDFVNGSFATISGSSMINKDIHNRKYMIKIIELLKKEDLDIVCMASTPADISFFKQLRIELPYIKLITSSDIQDEKEIAYILKKSQIHISGRYHMCIIAASVGTPFIILHTNTMKNAGLVEMLYYFQEPIYIQNTDKITEAVNYLFDNKDAIAVNLNREADKIKRTIKNMRDLVVEI